MPGFFDRSQIISNSHPNGKVFSCTACGLYKQALHPKIEPFGNFEKGILNIGEAPGGEEDRKGKPWQGPVGHLLQKTYQKFGVHLFRDCLNINSVNCRPTDRKGNNRSPTNQEITCCRKRVLKTINQYKPKVIVLLGGSAINSVIAHRWRKDLGGMMKWRGWTIPDRDFDAWICPVFHPSYVARSEKEVETIWMQDLERALSMADMPFPDHLDEKKQVKIIEEEDDLSDVLSNLLRANIITFDYETTGLKPHVEGHRIICMGMCPNEGEAYVFMMPERKNNLRKIRKILTSKHIGKIAHNMKYEHTWTEVLLGYQVRNWVWDTMLAAHLLDNRPGINGLKFQTYINFGVIDYDSEMENWLKIKDNKNGNSMNRILELIKSEESRQRLLIYCGMDALFTYKLAMRQARQIGFVA